MRSRLRGHLARQGIPRRSSALFVLLPIWVLVLMATDGSIVGYPTGFHPMPVNPTLDRFARGDLPRRVPRARLLGLLRNSLVVARCRRRWPRSCSARRWPTRSRGCGSRAAGAASCAVLLGAFLPPVALAAAAVRPVHHARARASRRSTAFGLRDSTLALAILYASFALPARDLADAGRVPGGPGGPRGGGVRRRCVAVHRVPQDHAAARARRRSSSRRSSSFLLAYTEFALAWLFIDVRGERDPGDGPGRGDDRLLHLELGPRRRPTRC